MDIYDSKGFIIDSRFPDCKIHETAIIGDNVDMGKGNIILPFAVIGQVGFIRDAEKSKGKVFIGDNNRIGCYVNIMSGEEGETIICNDNLIMNHVNIGHNTTIIDNNEIGAGTIIAGHVKINSNIKIKSGCTVRNRVEIKSNIVVGQGSNIIEDLKFKNSLYFGNPAKFVKRFKLIKN